MKPGGKLVIVFIVTALLGHAGQRLLSSRRPLEVHRPPVPAAAAGTVTTAVSIGSGNEDLKEREFIARLTELDLSSAVGKAKAAVWVARAAADDPVKTFDYLQSHDWENLPRGVKETFFNVWAGMDPDGAVAAMTALPAGPLRKDAECHLFHAMCEQQPVRALDMMLANGKPLIEELDYASRLNRYYSTFFNMALKDPELAKRNLERVPPESREQARQGITRSLARTDLAAALSFATSAGDRAAALLTTALQEGLRNQSDQAWPLLQKSLSGLGNPDRKSVLVALTREILNERPQEGFELLLSSAADAKEGQETETMIFNELARNNPTLALELMANRYPGGPDAIPDPATNRHFPEEQYIQALAGSDPAALVAYLGKHPETSVSRETEMVLRMAGTNDPAGMMVMLTAADASPSRQKAGASFLTAWANWDPQGAARWQAEHGTGNQVLETAWQEKLMQESIQKSPEIVALDFLKKETTASPEVINQVKTIAFLWSTKDPQAAAAWAEQLPAPELAESAVYAVSHQWLEQDSVAASEWISSLPPGKARNKAIKNLITAIRKTDPDSAKQWQETFDRENPGVKKP
jgi:hypothetical protein